MNQYFNINRFGKLFKKEFSERIPTIITISVIFSLILTLWWFIAFLVHFTGSSSTSGPESRAVYLLLVVILMVISAPLILYYRCNHRRKGVDYITLPASFNEKFVSMLIHTLILFPIAIGICVLATDFVISTLNPEIFNGSILSSGLLATWDYKSFGTLWSIFIIFTLFLFCNAIYKKNKTIKSIFSILLFFLIISIGTSVLAYILFHQWIGVNMDGNMNVTLIDGIYDLRERTKPFNITVTILLKYLMPVAAIVGSYFKMKRQQY